MKEMGNFNSDEHNFTDEEIITAIECCSFGEHCERCPFWEVEEDNRSCSDILYEKELKMIKRLRDENLDLRTRLNRTIEFPEYVFGYVNGKVEKISSEYLTLGELKNLEANGYYTTPKEAEKRLKKK